MERLLKCDATYIKVLFNIALKSARNRKERIEMLYSINDFWYLFSLLQSG